jgi:hypothetical protein
MFTSSQLYRPATNVEFLYSVADDIGVRQITPILTEMAPIAPASEEIIADSIWPFSNSKGFYRVIFKAGMDKGNAIRFEWLR